MMSRKLQIIGTISWLAGVALFAGVALAQPAPPVASQPERTFTFTVTASEVQVIAGALEGQPFKQVAPLLQRLQSQIQTQLQPAAPVEPKKDDK